MRDLAHPAHVPSCMQPKRGAKVNEEGEPADAMGLGEGQEGVRIM